MTRSLGEALSLLADKGDINLENSISRGIEKESLRVSKNNTISNADHPSSLGSALTNKFITTDFSEALLELITPTHSSIENVLNNLDEICKFVVEKTSETIWPSSIPCKIESEDSIRLADYGTSNSGLLKTLYRSGLSYRYGSMMQTVSGIHYNFSFSDAFFESLKGEEDLQSFKNEAYLNQIRNFRRNAWMILYLFGSSPVVPKTFITDRENFLEDLNGEDLFLEYATCLRMSELGYMSKAQDNLYIAYNNIDEYLKDLKNALTKEHKRYGEVGVLKDGKRIQINTSIIQIENEYYSSIRPKRVTPPGERPINILRNEGIDYVEIRALDNNSFLPSGIDEDTSYFLEAYLIGCFFGEDKKSTQEEIKELLMNWENVVKEGRNPNLKLLKDKEKMTIKDSGMQVIDSLRNIFHQMPPEMSEYVKKVMKSLDKQEEKLNDASLTPSGLIVDELKNSNKTWEELNLELAKKHSNSLKGLEKDLNYLSDEAKSSLEKFKQLGNHQEEEFEVYLDKFVNDI
jgi:glutamate--cysteine ligase